MRAPNHNQKSHQTRGSASRDEYCDNCSVQSASSCYKSTQYTQQQQQQQTTCTDQHHHYQQQQQQHQQQQNKSAQQQ